MEILRHLRRIFTRHCFVEFDFCFHFLSLFRTAARSRFMAAATPSLSPKIADPATSTLAPASTTSGAVVAIDTAVNLQVAAGLDLLNHLADPPNLWQGRVDEMLMLQNPD